MGSERLSSWLTLLANFGVIVGLGVLVSEIRQTTELTLAEIEQSRSEALLEWRQDLALSEFSAPLLAKVRGKVGDTKTFRRLRPSEQ